MKTFHLHLVSDSTGETVSMVSRACLVQFEDIKTTQHVWSMIRERNQIEEVIENIENNRGFVLYTLIDSELRTILEEGCRKLQVPCIPILDPIMAALGGYLGAEVIARPGHQHVMDTEYFNRIEAIHFVLNHDDGQSAWSLDQADVILIGVSRTSKTPTCIYLANRGIKAANVPLVPGSPLPPEVIDAAKPLIVGFVHDPKLLVQIRKNRLRQLEQDEETDYVDIDTVTKEVGEARRLFDKHGWPIIDVTRKSIEEVSATILNLHHRRREQNL